MKSSWISLKNKTPIVTGFVSVFSPHLEGRVGHVAGPTLGRGLRGSDGEDGEDAGLASPDVVAGPAEQSPVVELSARAVADTAPPLLLLHTDLAGLHRRGEVRALRD